MKPKLKSILHRAGNLIVCLLAWLIVIGIMLFLSWFGLEWGSIESVFYKCYSYLMKSLLLTLVSFASIFILLNADYYKEWFKRRPMQYWSDFLEEKDNALNWADILNQRYGMVYTGTSCTSTRISMLPSLPYSIIIPAWKVSGRILLMWARRTSCSGCLKKGSSWFRSIIPSNYKGSWTFIKNMSIGAAHSIRTEYGR